MACGGRAVVRFITINKSSSAPFSGRVDSIRLIAFHDPESSMINVNSSPSMASRLSSILTAAADVASDRIHDAGTVSPQGGNNQIVL
jgi:preprotein translocase subunit SecD